MHQNCCPKVFWNNGILFTSQIHERMSRDLCNGRSPIETLTGETPDVSAYLDLILTVGLNFMILIKERAPRMKWDVG